MVRKMTGWPGNRNQTRQQFARVFCKLRARASPSPPRHGGKLIRQALSRFRNSLILCGRAASEMAVNSHLLSRISGFHVDAHSGMADRLSRRKWLKTRREYRHIPSSAIKSHHSHVISVSTAGELQIPASIRAVPAATTSKNGHEAALRRSRHPFTDRNRPMPQENRSVGPGGNHPCLEHGVHR